ncbi:MAG: ECF transporter S component [Oscillospiraceae bacterium]
MKNTKKLVISALCVALGVVLPVVLHAVPNAGSVLLPMHLPVLLGGLICGPVYGLAIGALTPLLSSLITGMPPAAYLPSMLCELAVYGLVAGLLIRLIKTKSQTANIYLALIGAMLCGRLVYGALNALIFRAGDYSLSLWLTGAFVTALPGIVIQLVLISLVVVALRKAKLAPAA